MLQNVSEKYTIQHQMYELHDIKTFSNRPTKYVIQDSTVLNEMVRQPSDLNLNLNT